MPARTTLAKTQLPSAIGLTAGVAVVFSASDPTNGNQFVSGGAEHILVQNTDSASHTYTITSAPDALGRTKDLSGITIVAGAIHALPRLAVDGWRQTDGNIYLTANDVTVKFGILALP